ncbi:MAG: hypothetical protein DRP74_05005 [Candidatus Omnitrophota bacterium]|nr:MAG: hypothetical protein DRP74_05005 [Candidatus Omnitrophota bacterium]
MHNYSLEFILNMQDISLEAFKCSILEFGQDLEIMPQPSKPLGENQDFTIRINAKDPTIIFDVCGQFGKIKSVKIEEGR